ncbi:MAG: DinB family protein [Actinomycetota bacterium]|nr:DinB family protein [Actinomycetota bacterium]
MPFHVSPVNNEAEALAAFLAQQQDAFRSLAYGLSEQQAGLTPTAGALSIGGLVKHLTQVQESWLAAADAAPEPREPASRPTGERAADHHAGFVFEPTDTLAELFSAYDEVSARVVKAVGSLDLETPVPVPPAPWFPKDVEAWSVRWVWFHLLEEIARHAGHGDVIRESIDGAKMYELVAGRENLPATPWLTPWRPSQTVE